MRKVEVTRSPCCRHNPRIAGRARTAVLCAALALAGGAAAMPAAVQRVELTWKLEPGTELVYRESQQFETELPQGMGMREALRAQVRDAPSLAMLDGMFSDEALRSQWAQGSLALPTEPVVVGSTWDSAFTSSIPGFGSMTVATSYRVESIDGDIVVIGSSGTMSLPDGAVSSLPVPVQLGDTTIVGTSRFDAGRGLLLGTESTMRFEMTMAIVGQEIVTETLMTTTLELIEGGG